MADNIKHFGKKTILLPRRPLKGLEQFYEVSRQGYLYSKRLGRMIRHTQSIEYPKAFIKVQVDGRERTVGIHKAIAESWFTPAKLEAIRSDARSKGVRAAAGKHDLHPKTVYYIIGGDKGVGGAGA